MGKAGALVLTVWAATQACVAVGHGSRLEWLASSYVRKWHRLPKCLSSVGLYSDGALSLPIPNSPW